MITNLDSAKIDVYEDFLEHAQEYGKFEFSDGFKKFGARTRGDNAQ